jgi:hypothetical protein
MNNVHKIDTAFLPKIQRHTPINNMTCIGKDRHNKECRNRALGETRCCKLHQYLQDYTDEMLARCTLCSGCNKMYDLGEEKTCANCRERSKLIRETVKETVILCKSAKCTSKQSSENEYCLKHQICILVEQVALRNKRLCVNFVRGCREELELNHKTTRCETCLAKDRAKDKQRRTNATATVESATTTDTPTIEKSCTVCCKVLPIAMFAGVKGVTKTCQTCRDNNKKQDANRDKEHRNEVARKNEAKPECKAVKQTWRDNNYEKVATNWMNSRKNQMETLGVDEYLKRNAAHAKTWRDANPNKVHEFNESKKQNIQTHYYTYQYSANTKNLVFELTYETFIELVSTACHYCGTVQHERGFNGIDRLDSAHGYTATNCVSCCQMCNYVKGSLSADVFVLRIEHILSFLGLIDSEIRYPHLFSDYKGTPYSAYKARAEAKTIEFTITIEQYDHYTQQPCYLCGKTVSDTHTNGIDRYDNTAGYTIENIRSCCAECNYMKREYTYDALIEKYVLIHSLHHHSNTISCIGTETGTRNIVASNRKSKSELKQERTEQKTQRRNELVERCTNLELIQQRAHEVAARRSCTK